MKRFLKELIIVIAIGFLIGLIYEFIVVIFWGQYTFIDPTIIIKGEFIAALITVAGLIYILVDMELNE